MLMVGCISVVFYSLSTITNSILQGIDKMRIPVIHSAIAILIHVVILVGMLYIFNIDVFCLVICDMLFALIVCILNARSLKKYIGYKQEIKKSFLFPAICSVLMGVCSYFISQALYRAVKSYAVSVLVTIIASVLIYGILLLLFRVIDDEEIYMLPGGAKIYALAKKIHLIR